MRKQVRTANFDVCKENLQGFDYRAGTDAAGANLDGRHTAIRSLGLDLLQVWVPGGTGFVVGMAYVIAGAWAFAADFTFSRHCFFLLCKLNKFY